QPSPAEQGWLHCGQNGAGHFVKMVHNGIEYGMMASLAEGLNVLHNADIGTRKQEGDSETAPLENPEYYQYDIDTTAVAEVWRRGSVIGSWLLDLLASSLYSRFSSRQLDLFADKALSAMRKQFGGHDERQAAGG